MLHTINLRRLISSVLIPVTTGLLAWFFTRNSMDIYSRIISPPLSPPGALFPVVWSLLYVLMGVSLYIVRDSRGNSADKSRGYLAFAAQLVFNFLWTIVFFNLGWYIFADVWLMLLIILITLNIFYFGKVNSTAAALLVPYLLWCVFALYLNIGIAILN